jgi:hypothetical protein
MFANNSLDPASRYGLPDLSGDSDAQAGPRTVVFSENDNEAVAVMSFSFFGQQPVFRGLSNSIRLGKRKSIQ